MTTSSTTYSSGTLRCLLLIGTLFFLLSSLTATLFAQSYQNREGDSINAKYFVKAGFYYPFLTTTLRLDGQILGTEIGLEDDLGLSEELGVFRADGFMRLGKNGALVASYTSIRRSNDLTVQEDIEFQDVLIEAGSGAKFNFDVDYIAATYRYSFFNKLNWNAGASVGLRAVIINTGFEARLNSATTSSSASFTAPAMVFGVHGSAYLTPRLLARYALEFFYLRIEGVRISIIESNASVTWFFSKSVGVGLAYSTNNYRVENLPIGNWDGKVNLSFGGLNAFIAARF